MTRSLRSWKIWFAYSVKLTAQKPRRQEQRKPRKDNPKIFYYNRLYSTVSARSPEPSSENIDSSSTLTQDMEFTKTPHSNYPVPLTYQKFRTRKKYLPEILYQPLSEKRYSRLS